MKMLKRTLAFICIIATVLNFSAVPIFADGTSSNSAFPIEIFEDLASLVNLDRVQKQPADGVDASAFDNDTSTSVYWTAQWWYDLSEWNYVWEMKEPVRLYGYSFEALNPSSYDYRTREEACTWRLYGSDSFGTKGKLISSVEGVKHTEGMTEVYPITDPTPYKYYFLDIVWTDGLNDEYFDEMSIGEIHLYGNPKAHDHSPYLSFVPAIAATTETEGRSAHYACVCGKLFKDAEGKNEITDLSSIVIPKRNPTATGQVVVKADDGTFKVERVPAGIDVTKPISKDNWGESVIHVDKDTDNASIWAHNAAPDVSEMDVYLRWDDKYVYIGVVSPDPDPRGNENSWEADGIQFKLGKGSEMPADAKNIYFTLDSDLSTIVAGDSCMDYAKNVQIVDGKLHASIAVPFEDLGLVEADIKAGAELSFSILRISGTSEHEYAGWLSWGAFFGKKHQYNANCYKDNVIVLSDNIADTGTSVVADKALRAPDVTGLITADTWGQPTIKINKDSRNTSIWAHNATPDVSEMDVYLRWDNDNLYIGIVSPDPDPRGNDTAWEADGLQFKLCAGNRMASDAKNIYFTLDSDLASITEGDSSTNYTKSIKINDGKMHAAIAVPFADLGLTADDIKAGTELCFSILRISGTSEHAYAGWLSWGAFFGSYHQYNANCGVDNVIILGSDVAQTASVVNVNRTNTALDMSKLIYADTWGVPTISVNKNSGNTSIWAHNATPDVSDMDVYLRWDDTNVYIGVVSPDPDPKGNETSWEGDGIQFKLCAGNTMSADAKNIYFTLGSDLTTVVAGDSCNDYEKSVQIANGKLYALIAVPFADLGLTPDQIKAGTELCFSILRISGTSEHEYAGWLAWGAFFGANHQYNANCAVDNIIVLSDSESKTTAVNITRLPVKPNLSGSLNPDAWGKPTISVNKDSFNTSIWAHNATPDVSEMDVYLRWDDNNLYVGVVSPDPDPRGNENSWEADGIQFKVCAGNIMSADAKNIYFTLDSDLTTVVAGDSCMNYEKSVQIKDGKMTAMIAVPLSDLGLVAEDIKAGTKLCFSILRISGTSEHEYAGWLSWGAFFGANHQYNANSAFDNVLVFSSEVEETGTVVFADHAVKAPDMSGVITADTWGKPAISVDKNSYNTSIWAHNATPDVTEMDLYTLWDANNLYIGVVSADPDPRGNDTAWEADGLQFKLCAGNTMAADAKNIYFTLDSDLVSIVAGDSCKDYTKSIKMVNGKMHAIIAVPFADLGLTSADVKAGTELCFSILRISGTSEHEYAGWLSWGAFFGANHQYNANCASDNVIVLGADIAENAAVIKSEKTPVTPDLSKPISSAIWGKPAISVDKDSFNTSIWAHNATPDVTEMDLYTLWDATNLYIGVVSADPDPRGNENSWEADGLQFKLCVGDSMTADAKNIYFTLDSDLVTIAAGDSCKSYDKSIQMVNGKMHAMIAVPFADLGLTSDDIKDGTILSFSILRISGTSEHEYAGWLAWGAFFGANHQYNANCAYDNIIVLVDSGATVVAGTDEFVSKLTNIKDASKSMMSEAGISNGHKVVTTANGSYVVYLTRSGIVGSKALNEFTLQKIGGGKAEEIAYGYTNQGLLDIAADKDGNLYVIGGSSSWALSSMSTNYNYKDKAEKALISIKKYDIAEKTFTGYDIYKPFTVATEGYKYLTSTIDTESGIIYIAFTGTASDGKTYLEIFRYNIKEKRYESDSVSKMLAFAPTEQFAYINHGFEMIYGNGTEIRRVNANVERSVISGNLRDAYCDNSGKVHIVFEDGSATLKQVIVENGKPGKTIDLGINKTISGQMIEAGGKFWYVGINMDERPATAYIFSSDNGSGFAAADEITMDNVISAVYYPMIARNDSGSIETTDPIIMFAGKRGIITSWYYGNVTVSD